MTMQAWKVYVRNRLVDIVYYDYTCDAEYVRYTLINHDGYNPSIIVIKEK